MVQSILNISHMIKPSTTISFLFHSLSLGSSLSRCWCSICFLLTHVFGLYAFWMYTCFNNKRLLQWNTSVSCFNQIKSNHQLSAFTSHTIQSVVCVHIVLIKMWDNGICNHAPRCYHVPLFSFWRHTQIRHARVSDKSMHLIENKLNLKNNMRWYCGYQLECSAFIYRYEHVSRSNINHCPVIHPCTNGRRGAYPTKYVTMTSQCINLNQVCCDVTCCQKRGSMTTFTVT